MLGTLTTLSLYFDEPGGASLLPVSETGPTDPILQMDARLNEACTFSYLIPKTTVRTTDCAAQNQPDHVRSLPVQQRPCPRGHANGICDLYCRQCQDEGQPGGPIQLAPWNFMRRNTIQETICVCLMQTRCSCWRPPDDELSRLMPSLYTSQHFRRLPVSRFPVDCGLMRPRTPLAEGCRVGGRRMCAEPAAPRIGGTSDGCAAQCTSIADQIVLRESLGIVGTMIGL
ncbi:hypothetical protein BR93DRAFT_734187 [Coniochaeta sp. PMI_546]|nr:hypothetical protein BR93DRAFT_734187 [Coniochaeta sp. PMI_546]